MVRLNIYIHIDTHVKDQVAVMVFAENAA